MERNRIESTSRSVHHIFFFYLSNFFLSLFRPQKLSSSSSLVRLFYPFLSSCFLSFLSHPTTLIRNSCSSFSLFLLFLYFFLFFLSPFLPVSSRTCSCLSSILFVWISLLTQHLLPFFLSFYLILHFSFLLFFPLSLFIN